MKELITDIKAKGMELGMAKALGAIESRCGRVATPTRGDQGVKVAASSSATATSNLRGLLDPPFQLQ